MSKLPITPKQFLDLRGYPENRKFSRTAVEMLLHEYHTSTTGQALEYESDFFTLDDIDKRVAVHFFKATTKTDSQVAEDVLPRLFYFAVARINGFSLAEIGKQVGKDHATVIHGVRRFFYHFNRWEHIRKTAKTICSEKEFSTMCNWANKKYSPN